MSPITRTPRFGLGTSTRLIILFLLLLNLFLGCCCGFSVASQNPSTTATSSPSSKKNLQRAQAAVPPSPPPVIPITVLSGFLGSGKTTLLQHLLENQEGLKIAVVVNDVAAVNIDGRLIQQPQQQQQLKQHEGDEVGPGKSAALPAGMVELQNGCACCSSSDDFLASLAELVTLSDIRDADDRFDHIVVELSGVADPRAIRSQWQDACMYRMPLTQRLRLDTLVTVVDCSTFVEYLTNRTTSAKTATLEEAPQLFFRSKQEQEEEEEEEQRSREEEEGDNDMRMSQFFTALKGHDTATVAGLLAAQIETADVVLLNKVDLVDDDDFSSSSQQNKEQQQQQAAAPAALQTIHDICQALAGKRAVIRETKYGRVQLQHILGAARGEGVARAGLVDDHHDALASATAAAASAATAPTFAADAQALLEKQEVVSASAVTVVKVVDQQSTKGSHSHNHHDSHNSHSHDSHDGSHSHHHHNDEKHDGIKKPNVQTTAAVSDSVKLLSSRQGAAASSHHDHSHHSHNEHEEGANAADQNDNDDDDADSHDNHSHSHDHSHSHSHSHSHGHSHAECTDPSHDHSHDHHHHANIGTFVYHARRPFHPTRLVQFLQCLQISRGLPTDEGHDKDYSHEQQQQQQLHLSSETLDTLQNCIVRSKGFCWLSNSNRAATYWSHAGKSFELNLFGAWWATVPRPKWPPSLVDTILNDFDNVHHQEEDQHVPQDQEGAAESVGDRRQDVVLIGPGLYQPDKQAQIAQALNQCLLTDEEWATFRKLRFDEQALRNTFPSALSVKRVNF